MFQLQTFHFLSDAAAASDLQVRSDDSAAARSHFGDFVFQVHVDFQRPGYFALFEKAVHAAHLIFFHAVSVPA